MLEQRDARDLPNGINPRLLWTDIPYNTGKMQSSTTGMSYRDASPDAVLEALVTWSKALEPDGTMVVCCDYRMAWKVCDALSHMFYRGEIIWEFGLGRPRLSWWPVRHNNLLTFTHGPDVGIFHAEAIPRAKRLAPKAGYRGDKPSGSVWEFTMSNTHPDRVGYPNQKPLEIVLPFVLAHTNPGDLVADPFMGSGTTGVAALKAGRMFYGCDVNVDAVATARLRLSETYSMIESLVPPPWEVTDG